MIVNVRVRDVLRLSPGFAIKRGWDAAFSYQAICPLCAYNEFEAKGIWFLKGGGGGGWDVIPVQQSPGSISTVALPVLSGVDYKQFWRDWLKKNAPKGNAAR
jgi:hypothetical protein